jgi:hypothetical protein
VRKALGTLPWVEQDSVYTNVDTREVRFNLKDKKAFNEQELRDALKGQRFPEVTIQSGPPK